MTSNKQQIQDAIEIALKYYAQGFKDGLEEAKKVQDYPKIYPTVKPQDNYTKCPICGIIGTNGVVCWNHNCPTKFSCGTGGSVTLPGSVTNVGVGGGGGAR